jgi:hypothetical protein
MAMDDTKSSMGQMPATALAPEKLPQPEAAVLEFPSLESPSPRRGSLRLMDRDPAGAECDKSLESM